MIFILSVFAVFESYHNEKIVLQHLTESTTRTVMVIENSIRHAMLESDFPEVKSTLDSVNKNKDFQLLYLLDQNGKIFYSPTPSQIGTRLGIKGSGCVPCHHSGMVDPPISAIVTEEDGSRVFRSMYPIRNSPDCYGCHDPKLQVIGMVMADIQVAPVEQAIRKENRVNLAWWAGVIFLTAIFLNMIMNLLISKRLKSMTQSIHGFGEGNYDLRIKDSSPDEIGQLAETFNTMGQRIQLERKKNLVLSHQLQKQYTLRGDLLHNLITAQEDERKRIARGLHDNIGQVLGALSIQMQNLERDIVPRTDESIEQSSKIHDLIETTSKQMYDLIYSLRPAVLDKFGLAAAVRSLAERLLGGSNVKFQLDDSQYADRLPADLEIVLYRIIQEALTNIQLHAQAKTVKIKLVRRKDGVFKGVVEDDGKGFDINLIELNSDNRRGLGLLGMKERITQYGGKLEIISKPGYGTTIKLSLDNLEGFDEK